MVLSGINGADIGSVGRVLGGIVFPLIHSSFPYRPFIHQLPLELVYELPLALVYELPLELGSELPLGLVCKLNSRARGRVTYRAIVCVVSRASGRVTYRASVRALLLWFADELLIGLADKLPLGLVEVLFNWGWVTEHVMG